MAEEARREGAPGQEVQAAGGLDAEKLDALQRDILARVRADQPSTETPAVVDDESVRAASSAFLHENTAALDVPKLNTPEGAQPMPKGKHRKHTGTRRTERVGPVGFTERNSSS
ncbi:hypothetical protein [Kitasatospora sp. NPDC094015]|uniref:hypothetical protein n=1 Tax=Kitasatospora sp. NPDC094015 TaxID=3155205 RepID=UPI0033227F48